MNSSHYLAVWLITLLMFWPQEAIGKLAFVANIDGNWDLFICDDNGSHTTRLTNTPYDEKQPRWSFDKKSIVYATSDGHVNLISVDKKRITGISGDDLKTPCVTPCFSPNGKRLAFARFRPVSEGDDTDLMIYDIERGKSRLIIDQPSIQWWPTWSPDGRLIAYVNSHCSGECGRLIQELWLTRPGGGWARQLLLTNSLCQQPAWSYDGTKIAFSSDMGGNFDIWVLSLKDSGLQQVTTYTGLDQGPAWSPDGRKMAFVSTRSGQMEIWIKDIESGDVLPLKPFGDKVVECKDVTW